MPVTVTNLAAAGTFLLAAAWFFILVRALSKESVMDFLFFGNKPPKDPD